MLVRPKSENYKPFSVNSINKMKEGKFIKLQYVPTNQNSADICSKGCFTSKILDVSWKIPL